MLHTMQYSLTGFTKARITLNIIIGF